MQQNKGQDISDPGRTATALPVLNPTRVWWGLVFGALGVLGVLHVAGILDWNQTVDDWWPIAIIGWPLTAMLAGRRLSATAAVIALIGLGLLADEQHWTGRGIIWSAVFAAIGAAITFGHGRPKATPSPPGTPPGGHDIQADTAAAGSPRAD